jgi:GNAT superfamily N-acetyltransferase
MKTIILNEEQWLKYKPLIIDFVSKYGDKRITHKAIRWLKELDAMEMGLEGTFLVAAVDGSQIVGFVGVSDYGRSESIAVVHKDHRQNNIGKSMIQHLMNVVDRLYGKVALDNIPSLKMCMAMGMVGFKIFEGPTGKPTMWLGYGNWKKEDVE